MPGSVLTVHPVVSSLPLALFLKIYLSEGQSYRESERRGGVGWGGEREMDLPSLITFVISSLG